MRTAARSGTVLAMGMAFLFHTAVRAQELPLNPLEGIPPAAEEKPVEDAPPPAKTASPSQPLAAKTPPRTEPRSPKPGELLEFATPHLKDVVLDFLPVDLDNDGQDEIVLLSLRHLFVWRYVDTAFVEIQRLAFPRPFPVRTTVGRLVVGDLSGDGSREILVYISSLQRGGVFRWQDGGLIKGPNISSVPLAVDEQGQLLSTAMKPWFLFSGKDAKWFQPLDKGAAFVSAFPIDDAYAFQRAEGAGPALYALVDAAWKLKIVGAGFRTFLNERVGMGLTTVRGRQQGHFLLITSANEMDEAKDHLRAYYFDRQKLEPVWQGKPLGGQVTRVRMSDYDLDGVREAVALIRNQQQDEVKTRLVFLDLSQVEALEKRGEFSP